MQLINSEKHPIFNYAEDLEESALEQARNLANLPFAFKHVALMPDAHCGYGMPIGGVLATKGVIIPNAVGVDIGCGMCFVPTKLPYAHTKESEIKDVMGEIRKYIPLGFEHHKEGQLDWLSKEELDLYKGSYVAAEYQRSLYQIGTLGGGNHFIELQVDDEGFICIMIHSGSRNIGYRVANRYNELAKELNKKWFSSIDVKQDLAFLPLGCGHAEQYIDEMNLCLRFAKENRSRMMDKVKIAMCDVFRGMAYGREIDIHHNYAAIENHFGENVYVHRKGATKAYKGEVGIIPGSQGTSSYIVEGLGNPDSFRSCSHGAGRRMGRKQAKEQLNLEDELKRMEGVIHGIRSKNDLDEAAGAYKDIDAVMEAQKGLVVIKKKLRPIAVIKG